MAKVAEQPAAPASGRPQARRLKTLDAFESPAFRLLWLNTLSFSMVQGVQRFAFVWLVIDELGRGPSWGGIMTFAVGIPAMFLMLPAGVLSDRVSRRGLLIWTQLLATAVIGVGTALIMAGLMTVELALLVAVGTGATTALGTPVRTAVLPLLVERERLMNAIVLSTVGQNIMMIGGPIVAGAAIRLWGIEAGFALQTAAYGVGLLTLLPLRIPDSPVSAAPRKPLTELKEGFDFVLGRRDIKALLILLSISGLFMLGPVFALIPPIARDEMGKGAFEASMLFGVMAVGMLATSLAMATIGNFGSKGAWLIGNMAVGGVVISAMGLTQSYLVMAALMFVWGMGGGIFINLTRTLMQSHTPDAVMGRAMSIQSLAIMGLSPLGGLLAGALAEPFGAGEFMVVAGIILTVTSVWAFVTEGELRAMS